ncbi:unnamed protein product [Phytophthora fragariaefolia]|uniref:Unnamed protein product n=1 Tax=Phytophthora fragariaefolia TaxID=1490495 RepID=A0A9W7CZQ2_9STRA|nr:unnamed protein product [Phytophthora fragariaefolia]
MITLTECIDRRNPFDERESLYAGQQFKPVWGYKSNAQSVASFWAPAHAGERNDRARHGGVAILINPHGAIRDATPWQEHLWTAFIGNLFVAHCKE